jgi:hypothetical protein
MTLIDFYAISRGVAGAISRLKEGIISAESSEELELLTLRLKKACDVLSKASCKDAGRHEVREGATLIEEGRRLVFVAKMRGTAEEFPRIDQTAHDEG